MRWSVAANFFSGNGDRWLDDFIDDPKFEFVKISAPRRHDWHGGGMRTSLREWRQHFVHAWRTIRSRPDGIITCFPQLAFCVSLLKKMGLTRARLVAYNFNIGDAGGDARGWLVGRVLSAVDCFIVHSPAEVETYATWLRLPVHRFEFVPLQRGDAVVDSPTEDEAPYVLAMGSAHRDYATLIEAVGDLGVRTRIVCKPLIAAALDPPGNVELLSGLSRKECWTLLKGARLSVTPVGNLRTASGQVTLVDAMRLGAPVIVTDCPGAEGYVEHMETGILVPPFDAVAMRDAIRRAWEDGALRERLSRNARAAFEERFSDEAAAERLGGLLRTFA